MYIFNKLSIFRQRLFFKDHPGDHVCRSFSFQGCICSSIKEDVPSTSQALIHDDDDDDVRMR